MVDLSKYKPKIVDKMLRFIYQGNYDDGLERVLPPDSIEHPQQKPSRPLPNREAPIVNIKVFVIARSSV